MREAVRVTRFGLQGAEVFMFDQGEQVSEQYPLASNHFRLPARAQAFRDFVTTHPEMEKIFHVLEKVAPTNSTVLILGESGTGKELIARSIHELSRVKGHFVPVNCAAIPDTLLESELFGYERGAFTGAVNSKPGRFLLANNGTIFLDEIGEMSPQLQVKLLRVLQERIVEPVGGVRSQPVNVRVIAATHVDLRQQVEEGRFREDLYYRLQVVPINVPPLRDRRSDILLLANHFSQKYAEINHRLPLVFTPEVTELLIRYPWPGNVREIENLIERFSILVEGEVLRVEHLPSHMLVESNGSRTLSSPTLPESGLDFNAAVEDFENALIVQALRRTLGNKKAAAELLRLNRTTLVEKIKKKGLEAERFGQRINLAL